MPPHTFFREDLRSCVQVKLQKAEVRAQAAEEIAAQKEARLSETIAALRERETVCSSSSWANISKALHVSPPSSTRCTSNFLSSTRTPRRPYSPQQILLVSFFSRLPMRGSVEKSCLVGHVTARGPRIAWCASRRLSTRLPGFDTGFGARRDAHPDLPTFTCNCTPIPPPHRSLQLVTLS